MSRQAAKIESLLSEALDYGFAMVLVDLYGHDRAPEIARSYNGAA
jgi:hypothetical protein